MATLGSLLNSRQLLTTGYKETNLEYGRIWGFTPGNFSEYPHCAKWYGCQITCDSSKVVDLEIEIWGAGGRGNACICCCGGGVGGNPGAYMRITTPMTANGYIWIYGGRSCNSGGNCMCGGNSGSACVTICPGNVPACTYTCACICAQNGYGGRSMCFNSGSLMCCLGANGACITPGYDLDGNAVGAGCGIVCNLGTGNNWPGETTLAKAYIGGAGTSYFTNVVCCPGDVNRIACMYTGHCNPCCWNCHRQVIHTPPMLYATCGAEMQILHSWQDMYTYAGSPFQSMDHAVQGLDRGPTRGGRPTSCWSGNKMCECYEFTGCQSWWRPAMPSPATFPCNAVRSHGFSGGNSIVRIKYKGAIESHDQ